VTLSGTLLISKGIVKEREMAASVSNVYVHMVDSVIKILQPEFKNESLDDIVLNEVQAITLSS
jgi:transcription initiation factor TFIIA large subunit